ncbi:MAG TPA: MogA/MoaB family molybdenum cofactor biosynthesis protein [Solirubrobacterales bacterium]|nr:MogA/MoaB family molybdenum cofactor biosynthesis protein [Solirubrobacterales bacterium]
MTGAPPELTPPRVAVITVSSSRAARGGGEDASGEALVAFVEKLEGHLAGRELIADDRAAIEAVLRRWADGNECDLILTTGGTGFAPSDLTPEATEAVIERRAPGIAEKLRAASAEHTRYAALSRATAGIRGAALIVNFPGNPKAIDEAAPALLPLLPHAIALLRGAPAGHD